MAKDTLSGAFDFTSLLRREVPLKMTGFWAVWFGGKIIAVEDCCDANDMGKKTSTRVDDRKPSSDKLSHYDSAGRATMVDVSGKAASRREAEGSAFFEIYQ